MLIENYYPLPRKSWLVCFLQFLKRPPVSTGATALPSNKIKAFKSDWLIYSKFYSDLLCCLLGKENLCGDVNKGEEDELVKILLLEHVEYSSHSIDRIVMTGQLFDSIRDLV